MESEDSGPGLSAEPALRLPEAEEQHCHDYARARFLLDIAELAILVLVLPALTFTGAAARLVRISRPAGTPVWLGHVFFLLLLVGIAGTARLPIQCLSEYWLERRFGLGRESLGSWLWEWTCRAALFGLAAVLALLPVVEFLRGWPWLALPWCFAVLLLRVFFHDYFYAPLLARFYPVRFLRSETFAVPGVGRVTLPVYLVKVSHKTRRANAGIRLRGARSVIFVTDTLVGAFTEGEERVVMAHEFGHLFDQLHLEARTRAGVAQARRKLALGSAQLLAGCVSLCLVHLLAPALGLHGVTDLSGFPLLAALTLLLSCAAAPWLCVEARRDERDADEYALAITGDVESYLSVMRKLRQMNLEESCSSPLGHALFDTHPSYTERVRLALEYRRRLRPEGNHQPWSEKWRGWKNARL
jgi:STE24 endopeptidase